MKDVQKFTPNSLKMEKTQMSLNKRTYKDLVYSHNGEPLRHKNKPQRNSTTGLNLEVTLWSAGIRTQKLRSV